MTARRRTTLFWAFVGTLAVLVILAIIARSGRSDSSVSADHLPYIVHRPAGLSRNRPVPLVVVFATSNPGDMVQLTNFNDEADEHGFVVLYPPVARTYNDQARIEKGAGEPYPDLQSIARAIEAVRKSENIDPARIYGTGFSATGALAWRAACLLSTTFAALAPVGAPLPEPSCTPAQPVSIMAVYGLSDPTVTTQGLQRDAAHWRQVDGCPAKATTSTSGTASVQTWSPCRSGTDVALVGVPGQDHGWPSAPRFDATAEIWTFFATHRAAVVPSGPKGRLASVRVVKFAGVRRVLVLLVADEQLAVQLRLFQGARRVAALASKVNAGSMWLQLRVPGSVKAGRYRLELMLRTIASGQTTTLIRTVQLTR